MAIAQPAESITNADELRSLLARSEDRLVTLDDAAGAAELFGWLDAIAAQLPALAATGADARAELARWQGLQERLLQRGRAVLKAWGGRTGLAEARRAVQPTPERWWWNLDQHLAEQRRRRLLSGAGLAVLALLVIAASAFVLQRLFPVDPAARAAVRLTAQAEAALTEGDFAAAYPPLTEAITAAPKDAYVWALYGVVAQKMGDAAAAETAWQQTRALVSDDVNFFDTRGTAYLRANLAAPARDDLQQAVTLGPAHARSYVLLGMALDALGHQQEALQAYEQGGALADAAGDANTTAFARVQQADLIRRMAAAPPATVQP